MRRIADAVVELGRLSLMFGRVNRITYHEDGQTLESDTDHTVMLGLIGCAFASEFLPQLDLGLVAQYSLVHDLVEVYAGDTPTLRIDDRQRASKKDREAAALETLTIEFASSLLWIPAMIAAYEVRNDPEARYVKALDKLLPKITHILNGGKTLRDQKFTPDELKARYDEQLYELRQYASEFEPLFELRKELLWRVYSKVRLDGVA